MTWVPLLLEGIETTDGRLIVPGAVHWPTDKLVLPAIVPDPRPPHGQPLAYGAITRLRRRGPLVMVDLDVGSFGDADPELVPTDWLLTADLDRARFSRPDPAGPLLCAYAELAGAHVSPAENWPWADPSPSPSPSDDPLSLEVYQ